MGEEFFYGVTLSASHKSETWDPEAKDQSPGNSKLLLRQALLGPDAKPDELNVIQVETMSLQEAIKIPVAVLKVGEARHMRLDIEFPDAPVTFELIQGSGPVHLVGQNLIGENIGGIRYDGDDDLDEMEEEMMDEEEGDDSQFKEDENKRKASAGKRKQNEEEDEEEGEPKGKKAKMSNNAKGKAASPKKNAKK